MRLSKNFSLDEFLVSQTAARHNIDMTPSQQVIDNLTLLCTTVLQPLRDEVAKTIFVSSGFRPPELNTKIGGSKKSAHRYGGASDIVVAGITPFEVAIKVLEMKLPVDQCIHEFGKWVHLGIALELRDEYLTAYKNKAGKTQYVVGIQLIGNLT